jgi:hypothetical protein
MDHLTTRNREWLDQRFAVNDGVYQAHQPIYGFGHGNTEGIHVRRFCRTLNILRAVLPLQPASILDVGGAEGYSMSIARHLLDCDVVNSDLSVNACRRAREFWGLRGAALDATDLPFVDDAFDLVWCSEVIEHLAHPFQTIAELLRVARRFVLITTEEAYSWPLHRQAFLKTRDPSQPHFDRNTWTPRDFEVLFSGRCAIRPQFALVARHRSDPDPERARRLTLELTTPSAVGASTQGGIILVDKRGHSIPPPVTDRDTEILEVLFQGPLHACSKQDDSWTASLVRSLHCPDCRSPLTLEPGGQIDCPACGRSFGSSGDVLELFASYRKERTRTDEVAAVRRLAADKESQSYLLDLANQFEIGNVAKNRLGYLCWRVTRGVLNRARRALARAGA